MEASPTTLNLYAVAWPTLNSRYAIGQNGVFLRTSVFGGNWNLFSTLGNDFYDIKMWTSSSGFIVGSSANEIVMNTANGGTNWIYSLLPTPGRLNSVFIKASNTIVAVGANSRIRISTNYGYSWTIPTVEPNHTFYSVVFPVSDTGYVAGTSGIIYKSTNGGYNWTQQVSNTSYTLRSMSFINSKTGWIVGQNGIVLKTTTGGITYLVQNNQKIPDKFKLFQNYPNPFNPNTWVRFDLKESGNVSVKIYDVRGCFLTEILNEYKSAGEYTIRFDGGEYASGLYIYKMETKDYRYTKKMLLIR